MGASRRDAALGGGACREVGEEEEEEEGRGSELVDEEGYSSSADSPWAPRRGGERGGAAVRSSLP